MNILVTGATGLVGRRFSQIAIHAGHTILAVSRDSARSKRDCPFPATHITWDELESKSPGGVDAVVHLAGESVAGGPWTTSRRQKILDSRVETTKKLRRFFDSSSVWPKAWVNASAIGYYGDRGDEVLTEESTPGKDFLASVCRAWEAQTESIPSTSCRVTKLRIGLVLSNQGGVLSEMLPIFRSGMGGQLGDGRQWMSWIHLDDLAWLILHCLETETVHGTVNAVAPVPVTNSEFTKILSRNLGMSAFFTTPNAILKMLGDLSSLFLNSQKVTSIASEKFGYTFKYRHLEEALVSLIRSPVQRGVHEFVCEQWVPLAVEEVFPFFSDEKNLELLTPEILNFKVLKKSTPTIEEGTLIDYRLAIHGVPARWRTKILDWEPNVRFVDTQLKGPYKLWHHTHEFEALGGGTLMRDRVLYKLPMWPLGEAGLPLVKSDVRKIFDFRRSYILNKWGAK
jgi:uncharacterized protein (TIGR01777 family)